MKIVAKAVFRKCTVMCFAGNSYAGISNMKNLLNNSHNEIVRLETLTKGRITPSSTSAYG